MHVEVLPLIVGHDLVDRAGPAPGSPGAPSRHPVAMALGHVAEVAPGHRDGLLVGGRQDVAAAGLLAVHPRAAERLVVDLLPDGHLDHARRADVHRRLALDHDHDVGERGQVRRAGRRGSEQDADLGNDARELHLVVEDAAGVVAAGEDADLLGDPGARRVHEVDQRDLQARRLLLDADDLLDRLLAPGAGLHREVVGHHADRPAQHRAHARDHAVGGRVGLGGAGEEPVLLELGAGVEEEAEAVADEELALRPELVAVPDVPLPDARDPSRQAPLAHARHGSTGVGAPPGAPRRRYSSRERIAMIRTPA